jgi:hypothetical protein
VSQHSLSETHAAVLTNHSGIAPAVVAARGYSTVHNADDLRRAISWCSGASVTTTTPGDTYGVDPDDVTIHVRYLSDARKGSIGPRPNMYPALVVPTWWGGRRCIGTRLRPDHATDAKYIQPTGLSIHLDANPLLWERVINPAIPLVITEGEKKADAIASLGVPAIALSGVWCFRRRTTTDDGEERSHYLNEWNDVPLSGRTVYVAFDSDAAHNENVRAALVELTVFLEGRGADVLWAIPPATASEKVGVDDWLATVTGDNDVKWAAFSSVGSRPTPHDLVQGSPKLERLKLDELTRRVAREWVRVRERGAIVVPEPYSLTDMLSRPVMDMRYRVGGPYADVVEGMNLGDVQGLWPLNGRMMVVAKRKTGKTTLNGNLVKSLVDDEPFLGLCPVVPVTGAVGLLDTEMSESMLQVWFRDFGVGNTEQVKVWALRGQARKFDILDDKVRAQWAERLGESSIEVFLLDCLSPCLTALGLTESNEDIGTFLQAFDALLVEAAVTDAALYHHMGHVAERARGASRLRDWPEAEWRLTYEKTDDNEDVEAGSRFLTAYGRDVELVESQLSFDRATRLLTLEGGSRADHRIRRHVPAVVAVVTERPGLNVTSVKRELKTRIGVANNDTLTRIIDATIQAGLIVTQPGDRNAKLLYPAGTDLS